MAMKVASTVCDKAGDALEAAGGAAKKAASKISEAGKDKVDQAEDAEPQFLEAPVETEENIDNHDSPM